MKVSRETPQVLIADAEFICNFCYGIMAQAIRSEVDKQKIELCSCVILNLSRFDGTKEMALQSHGLVTVAQMLLRWCDKECAIFNTLCSVIYVQVQCSRMRAVSNCILYMGHTISQYSGSIPIVISSTLRNPIPIRSSTST